MAIIRQGGGNPHSGKVMTTMGLKDMDKRLCYQCGEKKPDDLFTVNANGQVVCPQCAGTKGEGVLTSDGDAD